MSIVKQKGLKLVMEKGAVFCDSRELAKQFDKRHSDIIKKIELEIERGLINPTESSYKSRGKDYKQYLLTEQDVNFLLPSLKASFYGKAKSNLLYLLTDGRAYKIGITKQGGVKKRVKSLQTGNPYEITEVFSFACDNAGELEAYLHKQFADKRLKGEWFNLNDNDIKMIKGLI